MPPIKTNQDKLSLPAAFWRQPVALSHPHQDGQHAARPLFLHREPPLDAVKACFHCCDKCAESRLEYTKARFERSKTELEIVHPISQRADPRSQKFETDLVLAHRDSLNYPRLHSTLLPAEYTQKNRNQPKIIIRAGSWFDAD